MRIPEIEISELSDLYFVDLTRWKINIEINFSNGEIEKKKKERETWIRVRKMREEKRDPLEIYALKNTTPFALRKRNGSNF